MTDNAKTVTEETASAGAPSSAARPIKVGIIPLFSTWIYQCENGPMHLNRRLERLAHKLMREERNAIRRTNYGGWHYAFDLFEIRDPMVAEFRQAMEQHVRAICPGWGPVLAFPFHQPQVIY